MSEQIDDLSDSLSKPLYEPSPAQSPRAEVIRFETMVGWLPDSGEEI